MPLVLNEAKDEITRWREKKGFVTSWENMPEKLMLVVTEVSEAMEAYRIGDRENFNEEIADTFIRLLDICGAINMDIEEEIIHKMQVNEKRPHKHGKNC